MAFGYLYIHNHEVQITRIALVESMDNKELRKQEKFWNQLVKVINCKDVVPVVGEDLLIINSDPEVHLYEELARRYADYAEIIAQLDQPCSLSATVRSHPEFNSNPHDISQEIGEELEELNPVIPAPIRKLAAITDFNLFVSTTFDDLLEKAINQERFNGEPKTRVIVYSPKRVPTELEISEALSSGFPVIFQIFGNYKNPLQFALTEGDKLEYIHALHSSEYGPRTMLSELHCRPLLLIGNKFPDWLARTFLRLTRKTPLDNKEVPKQYLSDTETNNPTLNFFLKNFTANTEVVSNYSPAEFLVSLESKWREKKVSHSSIESSISVQVKKPEALNKPPPPNSIFISYAASNPDGTESKDKEVAIQIRNALLDAGLDAWLDLDDLKSGDDYARKIKKFISNCRLFIPIISHCTNVRENGFFRREWYWAIDRMIDFTGSSKQFIIPIVMGDVEPYSAEIPDEFRKYQFHRVDTTPGEEFIDAVRKVYLGEVC